jgi:single-stranded-DNA-specific exonuclease
MNDSSLSLTQKRWFFSHDRPDSVDGDIQTVLDSLLSARGIHRNESDTLPSKAVLLDMETACKRIHNAVEKRENSAIIGDYDCDGIVSTAQLVRFFQRHDIDPLVHLPHRTNDGYGVKMSSIQECREKKVSLLIIVDSGITAVDEVSYATESGIDVIIIDHHKCGDTIPAAYAILHPEISHGWEDPYPSTSGLIFLLLKRLYEDTLWPGYAEDCALAMLGTVSDCVELRGMNRTITKMGLSALSALTEGPIQTLVSSCKKDGGALTSTDIAFRIAPRINAAGRMDDPLIALRALLSGGLDLTYIDALNEERKREQKIYWDRVCTDLDLTQTHTPLSPLLMSSLEYIPKGLIGILAGKLTEAYCRPSLVVSIQEEICTGSLRSPTGYDITEGLSRISGLLESFGGHAKAAGCTFHRTNLSTIREALVEDINKHLSTADLVPRISIDAILDPSAVTLDFIKTLSVLEPHGEGNPVPHFLLTGISLTNVRRVGEGGSHLQAHILGRKAVGFGLGHLFADTSDPLDIVCSLGIDHFRGKTEPQMFIKDIKQPSRPVQVSPPSQTHLSLAQQVQQQL